ncbi:MAG: polymer-forming cytoskeletal protein [Spirochaetes bacterium]|jgi:cytoskeletal protein CcmA (bactofilin family)|nr:polymer-forming cytoskeletal protein [Spirochaetota bacterium]
MAKKIIQINKNPVYDFGMVATVFGPDTEFYGDLNFKQSLQINGYFEGEIVSDGYLVIGKGSTVKANVRAKSVIVAGEIHGNIEASSNIEIHENGKLYGNIRTMKLKIADGVVFEGNCEMIKPDGEIKKAVV